MPSHAVSALPLSDPAGWRAALEGLPHGFAHTWESCHAMRLTTGQETWLFVFEGAAGRAVCPFAERHHAGTTDVVTPYGFSGFVGVGELTGLAEAWAGFAAERGWVTGYLAQHPRFGVAGLPGATAPPGKLTYALDLEAPEAALFARLRANRRREVRRFEREGLGRAYPADVLRAYVVTHFAACQARREAGAAYALGRETLEALTDAPNVELYGAGRGDEPDEVILVGTTAHEATYLFDVARRDGQGLTTGLIWRAVTAARARGVPRFDLGGGVRPGDGVAAYKERFGGSAHPLVALQQVYRRAEYERLCRAAGVDSETSSGYFPPYRRGAASARGPR